jgi:peptidyl-tRNA hydrolase, PTH1 family
MRPAFAAGLPGPVLVGRGRGIAGWRRPHRAARPAGVRACALSSPPRATQTQGAQPPPPAKKPAPPRGDKLVLVGLGNPGPQFDNTRHNVGFTVVSEFASRNGGPAFKHERRFQAEVATVRTAGRTVHVVRPRTYMNNSGQAVRAVMEYYGVPLSAVLVVADDMALELGRLRLRAKGSAGGHNGLRSVEKCVGGNEYVRLKVGVGGPRGGADQWSDHVLGRFSRGDQKVLDDVLWDAMDVLEEWVREEDVGRIMNAFSEKKNRAAK